MTATLSHSNFSAGLFQDADGVARSVAAAFLILFVSLTIIAGIGIPDTIIPIIGIIISILILSLISGILILNLIIR